MVDQVTTGHAAVCIVYAIGILEPVCRSFGFIGYASWREGTGKEGTVAESESREALGQDPMTGCMNICTAVSMMYCG